MEEIQVGEYIRTPYHKIEKVIKIIKVDDYTCISTDKNAYDLQWLINNNVKHSKNIIDLIEVGDFVNGILVTEKDSTLLLTEIKGIDHSGYIIPISQYGEGIKTILTKEVFENNCYRIGE